MTTYYNAETPVYLNFIMGRFEDSHEMTIADLFDEDEIKDGLTVDKIQKAAYSVYDDVKYDYVNMKWGTSAEILTVEIGLSRFSQHSDKTEMDLEDFLDEEGNIDEDEVYGYLDIAIREEVETSVTIGH